MSPTWRSASASGRATEGRSSSRAAFLRNLELTGFSVTFPHATLLNDSFEAPRVENAGRRRRDVFRFLECRRQPRLAALIIVVGSVAISNEGRTATQLIHIGVSKATPLAETRAALDLNVAKIKE